MIVAVLAGGRGRRLGAAQTLVSFAGASGFERVVVAMRDPPLPAVEARLIASVNTPEELAAAEAEL